MKNCKVQRKIDKSKRKYREAVGLKGEPCPLCPDGTSGNPITARNTVSMPIGRGGRVHRSVHPQDRGGAERRGSGYVRQLLRA